MAYQKPELIDGAPMGDTVNDGIMKTDINVDDIYAALNELLTLIPSDLDPNAYYRVDGSNHLTHNFQAGNFILNDVADPLVDSDGTNVGWCNRHYLPLIGGTVTGLISCDIDPVEPEHLANKLYVDTHGGGGGGEAIWGQIGGDIMLQDDLVAHFDQKGHGHSVADAAKDGFMSSANFIKLDDMKDAALLMDFLVFSEGTASQDHPVKLDDYGVLDVSFLSIKIFNLVGDWTPTPAQEYPSPAEPGDYWIIEGVGDLGSGGYEFVTGKLDGRKIYDNELLVKGRDDRWGIIHLKVDPTLYYKLDGSNHLTADFQAGGHKLSNIAPGTAGTDAVSKSQLDSSLGDFLPLTGGSLSGDLYISTTAHSRISLFCQLNFASRIEGYIDGIRRGGTFFGASNAALIHYRDDGSTPWAAIRLNNDGSCLIEATAGVFHGVGNKIYSDAYHPGSGGTSWEDVRILDVGKNVPGDEACRIDFHSQAGTPDYDFVISRNAGINGDVSMQQMGTGNFNLYCQAGDLKYNDSKVWTDDYNGGGGGGAEWGSITGDITQQSDLMTEFGKKSDSGHSHPDASTTTAGFMSSADKTKLDNLSGSTVTSVNGETGDVVLDYSDVGAAAASHAHSDLLAKSGGTMTGMINMKGASDNKVALPSGGGSKTIDLEDGSFFTHDNSGSSSSYSMLVPSGAGAGLIFVIYLSGSGSKTFTNTSWVGGNAPDGNAGIAVIYTDNGGSSNWIGAWGSMS